MAKVAGEISIQERGLALREAYVTTAQSERNRRQQLITEAEGKLEKLIERADELEKIKIVAEEEHSAVHDKVDQRLKAAQEAKYVNYFLSSPSTHNRFSHNSFNPFLIN